MSWFSAQKAVLPTVGLMALLKKRGLSPPRELNPRLLPGAIRHPIDTLNWRKIHWLLPRVSTSAETAFTLLTGHRLGEYDSESVPFTKIERGVHLEEVRFLYAVVRTLNPKTIVETGVAHGVSTSGLLAAVARNGNGGRVTSVDVTKNVGELIPPDLRRHWALRVGKSSSVLPSVLEELGQIDVFFHDSEHSYTNMMQEFRLAWPRLRTGGVLMSHDADQSLAVFDFASEVKERFRIAKTFGYLSGIRKTG